MPVQLFLRKSKGKKFVLEEVSPLFPFSEFKIEYFFLLAGAAGPSGTLPLCAEDALFSSRDFPFFSEPDPASSARHGGIFFGEGRSRRTSSPRV